MPLNMTIATRFWRTLSYDDSLVLLSPLLSIIYFLDQELPLLGL
jgi:hypothetical protein